MKKIITASICLLGVFTSLTLTSCDKSNQAPSEPTYTVYDKDAHYLVFYVEGQIIDKMLTCETDTYKDLEPFFPTIPEKNGYKSEWEKINQVYQEKTLNVSINAYYTSIDVSK